MSRRQPIFSLRASVRKALAEAGDKGATLEELEATTGAERRELQRALGALGDAGEKFAAPITSKLWRHFATEAQRDAWVKRAKPAQEAKPVEQPKPATYTAGPSKVAPRSSGEPIITSATKITIAQPPLSRFHVPDSFRGEFSREWQERRA